LRGPKKFDAARTMPGPYSLDVGILGLEQMKGAMLPRA
jgi:hypothetical protein